MIAPRSPNFETGGISSDVLEEFRGTVIAVDRNLLTIEVTRHRDAGAAVLSNRTGRFTFDNSSTPFKVAMQSIQKVTYERRHINWRKASLLAHSSN